MLCHGRCCLGRILSRANVSLVADSEVSCHGPLHNHDIINLMNQVAVITVWAMRFPPFPPPSLPPPLRITSHLPHSNFLQFCKRISICM